MTNTRQVAVNRQQEAELAAIGLPDVEVRIYATLVRHPRSTVPELAELGEVSAARTARAVAQITAKGMATQMPGRPTRYLAVAPDVALGALLTEREHELRSARGALHRLTEVFREAARLIHPADLIEVITGTDNINARVAQVQQAAREQIRGFDKPPYISPPGQNLPAEERRLIEGIRYRVIYDRAAVAWPGRLHNDILPACAQGEQARVRAELPMKMFLADDSFAVVPISSSPQVVDAAFVIHRCTLLEALATLFEAEWSRAVPIGRSVSADESVGPPAYATDLLPLLAGGQTDAGIARALGWSERTTQRRVQQLMHELDAATRFQAGLAARERGWL